MVNGPIRTSCVASLLLLLAPLAMMAGIVTNSPLLPPAGVYMTPTDVHTTYPNSPFPDIILNNVLHSGFINVVRDTCPGFADPTECEREQFDSTVTGQVSTDGGTDFVPIVLTGPVTVHSFSYNTLGTPFPTEMVQLQLSGGGVMIRESPTLQSNGMTRIQDLGGGSYHVDSFFDIFTELSLDNGQTWVPSNSGASHVELVPEPGTYVPMGAGLLAIGMLRRRR